ARRGRAPSRRAKGGDPEGPRRGGRDDAAQRRGRGEAPERSRVQGTCGGRGPEDRRAPGDPEREDEGDQRREERRRGSRDPDRRAAPERAPGRVEAEGARQPVPRRGVAHRRRDAAARDEGLGPEKPGKSWHSESASSDCPTWASPRSST